MHIRQGTPNDALGMYELIQRVQVHRTSVQSSGLLEYPLSFSQVALRLTDNPFAVVADDGGVRAFGLSHTEEQLYELRQAGSSIAHDLLVARVQTRQPFLYMDMLCVDPAYQRQGLAGQLYKYTMDEADREKISEIYSATALRPWKNAAAVAFLDACGHELVEEVTIPTGLTFGLHRRTLTK